jgi:DNA-binding transcriptional regulator YiaG
MPNDYRDARTASLPATPTGYDTAMKSTEKALNPRDIRHRLGLNQQEFWGRIGVTQSGGSRYESGRSMPKPVQELLRLVHVDQVDVRKITRGDFQVIAYLKSREPTLYKRLRQEAASGGSSVHKRGRHR